VGLLVLKVGVAGLTVLLLVQTARGLGAQLGGITRAFGGLLWLVGPRITERPHLFSSLRFAGYLSLYVQVRLGQVRPRWLWLLVPTHGVWVHLHGGHLQGLALLGMCGLGEAVAWGRARAGGAASRRPCRRGHGTSLETPETFLRSSLSFRYSWYASVLCKTLRERLTRSLRLVQTLPSPVSIHEP
jgi:hypothetical protein